jgi:hypothetical protein
MGDWGINENASEKEKIKQEFNDFLYGVNSVGELSYENYSEIYDRAMELFDKMYEAGKNNS